MKSIIFICIAVMLSAGAYIYYNSGTGEHFGEPFKGLERIGIVQALNPDENVQKRDISLSGQITRQCPSSGCWFFIKDEAGNQIKIELGHMGLKFPMRTGHEATVEGRLLQKSDGWQLIGNGVTFGGKK